MSAGGRHGGRPHRPSAVLGAARAHGSWRAWVSWIQQAGDRAVHKIVCVPARSLTPLEAPQAYRQVPRRIFGNDGRIRPWSYR
jgi:hypothetical protein